MQPRAAGLAAELKKKLDSAEVVIEAGPQKSEFAVHADGLRVFSRLEQRRFPEAEELLELLGGR